MSGPRYNVASPGVGGAIKDAMSGIGKTMGGMVGKARDDIRGHQRDTATVDEDSGSPSNAGRQAQSTDAANGYL